ncbi:MAG: hypothetical protein HY537_17960 [Deltaproteobacteria bacterium]|nr:hypothetical protein [Deltaproteobacteria bacterium]
MNGQTREKELKAAWDLHYLSRLYAIRGNEWIFLKSATVAQHMKSLWHRNNEDTRKLFELAKEIQKDNTGLEQYLEKICILNRRAIQSYEDFEHAVREYQKHQENAFDDAWSPTKMEALLEAYSKFGAEDLQKLLNLILDPQNGGMGYSLRSKKISLSRWEINHDEKIIYLPEWYIGTIHALTDKYGGKVQRVSSQMAAELLHTAIGEEFEGKISERTQLYAGLSTAAQVSAGVIGIASGGGIVVVAIGALEAVEGMTKLGGLNGGKGYNPVKQAIAQFAKKKFGDSAEDKAEDIYNAISMVIVLGPAGFKILKGFVSRADLVRRVNGAVDRLGGRGVAAANSELITSPKAADTAKIETKRTGRSIKVWKTRPKYSDLNDEAQIHYGGQGEVQPPWPEHGRAFELEFIQPEAKEDRFRWYSSHMKNDKRLRFWGTRFDQRLYPKPVAKNKLAMPGKPEDRKFITEFEPKPGEKVRIRIGKAGKNAWGDGGFVQGEVLEPRDKRLVRTRTFKWKDP